MRAVAIVAGGVFKDSIRDTLEDFFVRRVGEVGTGARAAFAQETGDANN